MSGEKVLPQPRGEFVRAAGRMLAHTLQDVDQIVVRVDPVQPAGQDQAVHDPDMLGAESGRAEQLCPLRVFSTLDRGLADIGGLLFTVYFPKWGKRPGCFPPTPAILRALASHGEL